MESHYKDSLSTAIVNILLQCGFENSSKRALDELVGMSLNYMKIIISKISNLTSDCNLPEADILIGLGTLKMHGYNLDELFDFLQQYNDIFPPPPKTYFGPVPLSCVDKKIEEKPLEFVPWVPDMSSSLATIGMKLKNRQIVPDLSFDRSNYLALSFDSPPSCKNLSDSNNKTNNIQCKSFVSGSISSMTQKYGSNCLYELPPEAFPNKYEPPTIDLDCNGVVVGLNGKIGKLPDPFISDSEEQDLLRQKSKSSEMNHLHKNLFPTSNYNHNYNQFSLFNGLRKHGTSKKMSRSTTPSMSVLDISLFTNHDEVKENILSKNHQNSSVKTSSPTPYLSNRDELTSSIPSYKPSFNQVERQTISDDVWNAALLAKVEPLVMKTTEAQQLTSNIITNNSESTPDTKPSALNIKKAKKHKRSFSSSRPKKVRKVEPSSDQRIVDGNYVTTSQSYHTEWTMDSYASERSVPYSSHSEDREPSYHYYDAYQSPKGVTDKSPSYPSYVNNFVPKQDFYYQTEIIPSVNESPIPTLSFKTKKKSAQKTRFTNKRKRKSFYSSVSSSKKGGGSSSTGIGTICLENDTTGMVVSNNKKNISNTNFYSTINHQSMNDGNILFNHHHHHSSNRFESSNNKDDDNQKNNVAQNNGISGNIMNRDRSNTLSPYPVMELDFDDSDDDRTEPMQESSEELIKMLEVSTADCNDQFSNTVNVTIESCSISPPFTTSSNREMINTNHINNPVSRNCEGSIRMKIKIKKNKNTNSRQGSSSIVNSNTDLSSPIPSQHSDDRNSISERLQLMNYLSPQSEVEGVGFCHLQRSSFDKSPEPSSYDVHQHSPAYSSTRESFRDFYRTDNSVASGTLSPTFSKPSTPNKITIKPHFNISRFNSSSTHSSPKTLPASDDCDKIPTLFFNANKSVRKRKKLRLSSGSKKMKSKKSVKLKMNDEPMIIPMRPPTEKHFVSVDDVFSDEDDASKIDQKNHFKTDTLSTPIVSHRVSATPQLSYRDPVIPPIKISSKSSAKKVPKTKSKQNLIGTSTPSLVVKPVEQSKLVYNYCCLQGEAFYKSEDGKTVYTCPICNTEDNGTLMLGCDRCQDWYHGLCLGIFIPPPEEQEWFCPRCLEDKLSESMNIGTKSKSKSRAKKK